MDEIIYFFEETKYRVVFIEDLDRFDSSDIFVKLRELNTILNSYEKIHRRIVFIYAIKDNMFKENDRTKFFDFIIPVIPIISSTNSGDLLIERHNREKHSDTLDSDFFEFISPYINDMRILENIYNEFILYSETVYFDIDGEKKLELNDKKMFAILVFKNQYPSAFADMQAGEGIVKIGRVLTLTHGQGLGTRLIKYAMNEIPRKMECTRIIMDAQKHAVPFYEKLGFTVSSEEYLEAGIPHVDMYMDIHRD